MNITCLTHYYTDSRWYDSCIVQHAECEIVFHRMYGIAITRWSALCSWVSRIYSQLPISRTRKGPGKVSDLARCPTYQ